MFRKPFLQEGDHFSALGFDLEALRAKGVDYSWETLMTELAEAIGTGKRPFDTQTITYSTNTNPLKFSNNFTRKTLALIQDFEKAKELAAKLQADHEEIEASRPVEVPPEPQYDEEGELIEPKPKKKKEIKAEKDARKVDVERYQKVLDAQHAVSCLETKMGNVSSLHALRVEYL